jgi:hypothetical protein
MVDAIAFKGCYLSSWFFPAGFSLARTAVAKKDVVDRVPLGDRLGQSLLIHEKNTG